MRKIRVLVVAGAAPMRRLMTQGLATDTAIEVVGTASNGRIALAKIEKLQPNVVTLDLELPDMDGLELLRALQRDYPRLPVLVLSAGARVVEVATGAIDCVSLPKGLETRADATQWILEGVGSRIRALYVHAGTPVPRLSPPSTSFSGNLAGVGREITSKAPARRRTHVLVIGASTGGPNALAALLPRLGSDFPIPILIVQHMPPNFTRILADRLGKSSRLRVAEAVAGAVVKPGDVWIAPGDHHIVVERHSIDVRLALHRDPPENSCRPAADVLLRSAAKVYGAGVLAVVLTGMGQDGLLGCDAIRGQGGHVIVQDEASSVVWGMPGAVARAGLAHQVLPLDDIGQAVVHAAWIGRRHRRGTSEKDAA